MVGRRGRRVQGQRHGRGRQVGRRRRRVVVLLDHVADVLDPRGGRRRIPRGRVGGAAMSRGKFINATVDGRVSGWARGTWAHHTSDNVEHEGRVRPEWNG